MHEVRPTELLLDKFALSGPIRVDINTGRFFFSLFLFCYIQRLFFTSQTLRKIIGQEFGPSSCSRSQLGRSGQQRTDIVIVEPYVYQPNLQTSLAVVFSTRGPQAHIPQRPAQNRAVKLDVCATLRATSRAGIQSGQAHCQYPSRRRNP